MENKEFDFHKIPTDISIRRIDELITTKIGKFEMPEVNNMVLDLNSLFSTVCYLQDLGTYGVHKYISEINNILRTFISENLSKKIYIFYNNEKTYLKEHLGENYQAFFYEKRPKIADDIITLFIEKFETLTKLSNVKFINCGKFEPAIAIYTLLAVDKKTFVISRSRVVLQCINYGGHFWDGRFYYDKEIDTKFLKSNVDFKAVTKFPKELPFSMYGYYLCMRGYPLHGFKGVEGYGPKKTMNYLIENFTDIINGRDNTFNYEDFKYLYPSEFILEIVLNNDKIKEEYRVLKKRILE